MWHTSCILRGSVSPARFLAERFVELQRTFAHVRPQDNADYRRAYRSAHEELWVIAQALCALADPVLQNHLDRTRRFILQEIHDKLPLGNAIIKPTTRSRPMRWYEHELTPELTHDPRLTGTLISRKSLKTLRALLRAQSICVKRQLEINLASFKS